MEITGYSWFSYHSPLNNTHGKLSGYKGENPVNPVKYTSISNGKKTLKYHTQWEISTKNLTNFAYRSSLPTEIHSGHNCRGEASER